MSFRLLLEKLGKMLDHSKIKTRLEQLGHNFTQIEDSIFLVYNLFTEKEFEPLWEIVNNAKQKDWEEDYIQSQITLAKQKFGRSDLENLVNEGLVEITQHWLDKAIRIPPLIAVGLSKKIDEIFMFKDSGLQPKGLQTIQRQYENSELVEHNDNDADPTIAYAGVAYLNDDYSDGELYFSNLNIEIKPPARSFIIFPGGEKYRHGVRSPGPGRHRYALPTFVSHLQE